VRSLLASMSVCGLLLSGACASQCAQGADDQVVLARKGDSLQVTVGGEPFTVYHFAKSQKKPYFWPVRSPRGEIITRPLEKPKDHPHHKGLWFSVDEVNGIKFWAERGKIENISVEPIVTSGNPARFKVVNHWLGKDGQPLLIESTTISIFSNRLIAYDATLTAGKSTVTFEDTKEGLFGFRMIDPLREFSITGKHPDLNANPKPTRTGSVENSEGVPGTAALWGKTSDWIDYYGNVDGKTVGVSIFDNPHNFRRSRYHVRDYGLFSISPFGEHAYTNGKTPAAPVVLKPGEKLDLHYAIYIHAGDTKAGQVAATYKSYVANYATEQNPTPQVVTAEPPASSAPVYAPASVSAPGSAWVMVAVPCCGRHRHGRCCYVCVPQQCVPSCQASPVDCH
jgi:hypothetical protein